MATGRVLQFDRERGYGFIAADDAGEDVFLHASVYEGDADELSPGVRIEFKVMAGDRGRKAFAARSIPDDSDLDDDSVTSPRPASKLEGPATPQPAASQDVAVTPLAGAPHTPGAQARNEGVPGSGHAPDDEPMCDVLSREEFSQEVAELLLVNAPTLTGQQILQVRESMLECARKHGWIDI
jgi:CspA family cold shock protein